MLPRRGDGRRDAGDEVRAERDDDDAADGEHQQVEQKEHQHRPHHVVGHDAAAELHRQHAAGMQRAAQLEQRVARDEHLPDDLRPAAADPAQPPMNISTNRIIFAWSFQSSKSTLA
jgi:hypothetical protein